MKVWIDEIKVHEKKRIRKELGDVSALMRSMSKYGLLQPIILDRNLNLLAGYRRLLAAKQLGWPTIEVILVETKGQLDKFEIEIDENIVRKDFTFDEIDYAYEKREKLLNPGFFRRIWNFIKKILFGES
jgi:ParB family transcriptional regulator, chromosome partitioning protein